MHIDLKPCFTPDEQPLALRLLFARARRLGVEPGELLRAAVRDVVFDEAGRPGELTVLACEAADTRADAAQLARDTAARAAAEEAAKLAQQAAQEATEPETATTTEPAATAAQEITA